MYVQFTDIQARLRWKSLLHIDFDEHQQTRGNGLGLATVSPIIQHNKVPTAFIPNPNLDLIVTTHDCYKLKG